jgi:hypothetical protein
MSFSITSWNYNVLIHRLGFLEGSQPWQIVRIFRSLYSTKFARAIWDTNSDTGNMNYTAGDTYTYDHRSVKTGHPVRSAIHKH